MFLFEMFLNLRERKIALVHESSANANFDPQKLAIEDSKPETISQGSLT